MSYTKVAGAVFFFQSFSDFERGSNWIIKDLEMTMTAETKTPTH